MPTLFPSHVTCQIYQINMNNDESVYLLNAHYMSGILLVVANALINQDTGI